MYDAPTFIAQIKEMISNITLSVLADNSNRRIEAQVETPKTAKKSAPKKSKK
jgi:hypothetical protein